MTVSFEEDAYTSHYIYAPRPLINNIEFIFLEIHTHKAGTTPLFTASDLINVRLLARFILHCIVIFYIINVLIIVALLLF